MDASAAERACRRLASSHYENFPVATWLLPARLRGPLRAIYAYCRTVDDLGDEAEGDRLALLAAFERDLEACFARDARAPAAGLFTALSGVIDRFGLQAEPFRRLVAANRMDQTRTRYGTYAELVGYCELSANPVGHLVLGVLGACDERRATLSDATCTALQLTNFWQDVARDWEKGRLYIPREDMDRFGVPEEDIAARRATPAFRALMRFEVERTRALFRTGLALVREVEEAFRAELLLFSRGGWGILDRIERSRFDCLNQRPAWSRWEKTRLVWDTWRRRDAILASATL